MNAERWHHIERIFHEALDRPSREREAFLESECRGDDDLRLDVQSLLSRAASAEKFLDRPAAVVAAEMGSQPAAPTLTGLRLGVYEVQAPLGTGGMGEVYRALDTNLNRPVAIKFLSDELANPTARRRFQREARTASSLNHPHIVTVHDAGEFEGRQYLVTEFVDGGTLRDWTRGATRGWRQSIDLLTGVADGLAAAHQAHILHRDIKPENILITKSGYAKLADFGLAKLHERATADDAVRARSETHTRPGAIVGTAAYMSPEQASGEPLDARSDIFSFGVVLYELLAGERPFMGASDPDVWHAIIHRPAGSLPEDVPLPVRMVVEKALEKDPADRFQSMRDMVVDLRRAGRQGAEAPTGHPIADVGIEIDESLTVPGHAPVSDLRTGPRGRERFRPGLIVAAIGALAACVAAIWIYFGRTPRDPIGTTRLSISAPGSLTPQTSVAISPDGRRVAFVATDPSGRSMLWVREFDSIEPRVLAGTEDAAHPFWSPDGISLGFLAGGKLKRVNVGGGGVLTLADVMVRAGGSWSPSGVILFTPRLHELATVPATGGPISTILAGEGAGMWPFFLPDGRHFLFVVNQGEAASRGLYLGSLDSKETTWLLTTEFKGAYADPGYVLFVRGEALMAQPFDPARLKLSGEPAIVADGIWGSPAAGQASFSVSRTGVLAYINSALYNVQLTWVDRSGRSLGSLGSPNRYFVLPQLAPDGSRVAIAGGVGNADVWVLKIADGTASRLTFGSGADVQPIWAADGQRILFESMSREGPITLVLKDSSGAGSEETIGTIGNGFPGGHLWDWSRDVRYIVYSRLGRQGAADLWVMPFGGDRKPFLFAESAFHKTQAQISPNGRWIAYTSYESGRDEVYVQSFPTPGNQRMVSSDGGMQPRWRRDGAELFYLRADQYIMALPVKAAGTFEAGRPTALFRSRIIPQGSQSIWFDTAYDVTSNGLRFVLTGRPGDPGPPMTVVLNYLAPMRK